jgi:hypothetical protein
MNTYARTCIWYLAEFFLEWEMSAKKYVEKIKTHSLCSIIPPENGAAYEMVWKNAVEPDSLQVTV